MTTENSVTTGYEAELWEMADALRGSMDAAEYKHVVLGLIFLKYVSDAFEETRAQLEAERDEGADPELSRRVPRQEHLLDPARGALGADSRRRPASPTVGRDGRRRHGGHRTREPGARRACYRRTTLAPRWTRGGSAS